MTHRLKIINFCMLLLAHVVRADGPLPSNHRDD